MKFVRLLMIAAVMGAGAAPRALAAPAPRVSIATFAQLPVPLPRPYDQRADADRDVAAARGRARTEHKLLLIDLGGDWCGDCRILAATLELPEVRRFIDQWYVVAPVDIGHFDHNLQIPARYGITRRLDGVPSLLVIDPFTDRLLDAGHVAALADARSMTPQALADWLAQWTPSGSISLRQAISAWMKAWLIGSSDFARLRLALDCGFHAASTRGSPP